MQLSRERSDERVRNVRGQKNTVRTEMEIYIFSFVQYTGDCSTDSLLK